MEKRCINSRFPNGSAGNLLKKMKLLFAFFFAGLLSVSASTYSQQTKLSLKLDEVTVKEVFKQIESQSEFVLFYNEDIVDVNRKVSIDVTDQNVENILNELFKGTDNTFKIYDRQIVISSPKIEGLPQKIKSEVEQPQKKSISGKVTDSKGQTLPGVSVVVKETTIGTITDANGNFSLQVPFDGKVLVFSFVGMKTQEVPITGKSSFNISMEEETVGIDEVVAVGYGTTKRSHLTGAVASIKSEQLTARPVTDIGQALAGQVAGVDVGSITSPGATPSIVIRGYRSINNNKPPLYVVDGIPREDYNDIPVSEISNVEVLKDAIATAVYGSRAANGVILITTKNAGKVEKGGHKIEVGFSGFYGLNSAQLADMMTGDEYVDYRRDRQRWTQNGATNWSTGAALTDAQIFSPQELPTVVNKKYVDWESLMYKKTVSTQEYNIYVDNSTERSRMRFSAGYNKDEGYYPNSDFKRLSLGFKIDQKILSFLDFNSTIRFTNSVRNSVDPGTMFNGAGTNDVFRYLNPLIQGYDDKGIVIPEVLTPYANPMLDLLYPPVDKQTDHRLFSVFNLKATLFKGLTFTSSFGWDARFRSGDVFQPKMSTKRYMVKDNLGAYGERSRNTRQGFTLDNYFNYDNTFNGKHNITATIAQSIQSSISDGITMQGNNLPDDALGYWNMNQFTLNKDIFSSYSKTTLSSFIGRFQYTYDNRYMANFSLRRDGSSVLSPGYKWGTFPAGSLAWIITNEKFFKVEPISLLKLRGSYGTVGAASVDPYQSFGSIYSVKTNFGNELVTGYGLSNINSSNRPIPNKALTWEKSTTLNIGLDWGLLGGRISGYVELYRSITSDLIFTSSLATHSGFTETTENVGSTLNRGVEANISSVNINNSKFKWVTDINFSTNKGVIKSLKGGVDQPDDELFIGKPWRIYYDNVWTGIWQINDPDLANYVQGIGTRTGELKFLDITGPDGVKDRIVNDLDYVILGVQDPKWMMYIRNTFSYKNFTASIGLNGKFGNMIQMSGRGYATGYPLQLLNDYWTPDNPGGKYNLLTIPGSDIPGVERYRKGDYIRVQELSLNYRLKTKWAKEMNLGIYTSNPFFLYRAAKDCIDPTASQTSWQTWKSYTFKVDLKF
jgi:TonB-linked SusC/RagA family outer membrane protein